MPKFLCFLFESDKPKYVYITPHDNSKYLWDMNTFEFKFDKPICVIHISYLKKFQKIFMLLNSYPTSPWLYTVLCLFNREKIEKCHTGTGIPRPYPRHWRTWFGSIKFIPRGSRFGSGPMFHYKGLGLDDDVSSAFDDNNGDNNEECDIGTPLNPLSSTVMNQCCGKLHEYTLPCSHALASCKDNNTRTDTCVSVLRKTYRRAYQSNFYPIMHEDFWRDAPYNLIFYHPI
ncbi:hypothetical protein M9H77_04397 [Catharanthus roseus]|uniref:Uncharacterized protein n=1 Tax=Catharanthus roseus TaxID=4058 RepID=A0ACC0CE53_CATRO|nr:hypothetical protein M9H77_04397 [Catharanthus roseus]